MSTLSVNNIESVVNLTVANTITIGNSTVNTIANSTAISVGNSSANVLMSNGNITINGNAVSPVQSFRNKIINGNFDFWQRATNSGTYVAPVTNYYQADRWVTNVNGTGGNGSVSRQAFTVGQTDVPNEPAYFHRWTITSAASGQTSGSCYMEQRIEDVRTLAGKQATLSLYMQGSGTLPSLNIVQNFGSGGSTLVVVTPATNIVLNASWTKYIYTIDIPSISGKTIGTASYLAININVPINTTFTLDIAQVQLESGSVATPFEMRPLGMELALCQRYYEVSASDRNIWSGMTTSGWTYYHSGTFAVVKRATPTMAGSLVSVTGFNNNVPAFTIFVDRFYGGKTATSTSSGGYFQYAWTASAEL